MFFYISVFFLANVEKRCITVFKLLLISPGVSSCFLLIRNRVSPSFADCDFSCKPVHFVAKILEVKPTEAFQGCAPPLPDDVAEGFVVFSLS